MKNALFIFLLAIFLSISAIAGAQCSICTRTAQQMGEKPARELNRGILYLALTPLAIGGFIAFRWMKKKS